MPLGVTFHSSPDSTPFWHIMRPRQGLAPIIMILLQASRQSLCFQFLVMSFGFLHGLMLAIFPQLPPIWLYFWTPDYSPAPKCVLDTIQFNCYYHCQYSFFFFFYCLKHPTHSLYIRSGFPRGQEVQQTSLPMGHILIKEERIWRESSSYILPSSALHCTVPTMISISCHTGGRRGCQGGVPDK